jgi:dihydrofolate reductase
MNVALSMAISVNGLMARENGEEDWLSSENWDDFLIDVAKFDNFIVGREAFELVQKLYPKYNFDDVNTANKIVVTHNRGFMVEAPYVCAFSPADALARLESVGVQNALLIGGGKINSAFIKENLVNEIWLTINPHVLGKGRPFIAPEDFDISLNLLSCEPLSEGRLRLKYSVRSKST